MNRLLFLLLIPVLVACGNQNNSNKPSDPIDSVITTTDTIMVKNDTAKTDITEHEIKMDTLPDTVFVLLQSYAEGFAYNMKYATEDNFLGKQVYPCPNCIIRKGVADALILANKDFNTRGYRIQFFDCYRPLDVQKQMWEIYPDARYVANPHTKGSIHNRGGAVDITLQTLEGRELDMGTGFDHFGKEAHQSYTQLPDSVLQHRKILKEVMMKHGFNPITSEWWHYNYTGSTRSFGLSNFPLECE